ncbi:MAG: M23 family metallopeptidase, partial [Anaerolineae bacterium]
PPTLTITLDPPQVEQGHTLLVRVHSSAPVTLTATLDDRPLTFVAGQESYWALVGLPAWSQVGPHPLRLMATDALGRQVREEATVKVVAVDFPVEAVTLPPDRAALLTPELVKAERERLAPIFQSFTPQRLWKGTFDMPVAGEVTSPFGVRRSYNGGPARGYHEGVDFRGEVGTTVVAANGGRVALAETLTVRGKAVILDHGLGVHSGYYHLSELLVQEGQRVAKGDPIGRVGQTGLATGPHLHWEIRVGGVNVNPLEWTERPIPR